MKKLSVLLFAAAACGGGGNSRPNVVDSPDDDDAPQANCLVADNLGTVAPSQQIAEFANGMDGQPEVFQWIGDVNQDAAQDIIALELYKGFGVFTSGFPTGPMTVSITGAETNYETCGACIRIFADIPEQGDPPAQYFATAGSISFTSLTTTLVEGTISNVTMTHVNVLEEAPFTSSPHPDGCTANLGTLAFSAVPTMAQEKKTGAVGIKLDPSTLRIWRRHQ